MALVVVQDTGSKVWNFTDDVTRQVLFSLHDSHFVRYSFTALERDTLLEEMRKTIRDLRPVGTD